MFDPDRACCLSAGKLQQVLAWSQDFIKHPTSEGSQENPNTEQPTSSGFYICVGVANFLTFMDLCASGSAQNCQHFPASLCQVYSSNRSCDSLKKMPSILRQCFEHRKKLQLKLLFNTDQNSKRGA